jgi:hypothetical protein
VTLSTHEAEDEFPGIPPGSLVRLKLTNNGLNGMLPTSINSLKTLVVLNLYKNQIEGMSILLCIYELYGKKYIRIAYDLMVVVFVVGMIFNRCVVSSSIHSAYLRFYYLKLIET